MYLKLLVKSLLRTVLLTAQLKHKIISKTNYWMLSANPGQPYTHYIRSIHTTMHTSVYAQYTHNCAHISVCIHSIYTTIHALVYAQYTHNYTHINICTVYTQLCTQHMHSIHTTIQTLVYAQYAHNYSHISICTVYTQLYTH